MTDALKLAERSPDDLRLDITRDEIEWLLSSDGKPLRLVVSPEGTLISGPDPGKRVDTPGALLSVSIEYETELWLRDLIAKSKEPV